MANRDLGNELMLGVQLSDSGLTHCRKSVSSHLIVPDGWPGDNVFTSETHRILPGDQGRSCALVALLEWTSPLYRSWARRRTDKVLWTLFKCIAHPALHSTSESSPPF